MELYAAIKNDDAEQGLANHSLRAKLTYCLYLYIKLVGNTARPVH